MPTARTNDNVALSYKTNGSGRCHLLFIHDWGGSGAYFDQVLKHMDLRGVRAITYDLRGHGDSGKPETGYTLQRFAQDTFDVADHAGATRIVLIGFGMGAKLAQYAATFLPERIKGLILVAGCPASPVWFPDDFQQDWVNQTGNREKLLQMKHRHLTRPVEQRVIERWADSAVRVPKEVMEDMFHMLTETTFTDRLERINCPIVVIGGDHDSIFSPATLQNEVAAPLGNVHLAILDCNHEIPLEQPLELAGFITAFLAGMKAVPLVHQIMT